MARAVAPLPTYDRDNGWSAPLPARTPRLALEGHRHVDWLVVGAGYAGLAAARELATRRPDDRIAVVEAGVVGENASGRNSGFAIDLPHSAEPSAESIAAGLRAIRVNRFALALLDRLIAEHRIGCDWQRSGRYHAAVTEAMAQRLLPAYVRQLDAWGEPYERLDRAALHERLGTEHYASAVYTPGTWLLNPAALIRGLADSLPPQVTLHEQSPVVEAGLDEAEPWVRTERGRVTARGAILAVNAYAEAFGIHRERQVPILLFASLTAPLDVAQRAALGSDASWGLTPAHATAGCTLRLTADRRLLVREGFAHSPTLRVRAGALERVRAMHRALLERRFPQLGALPIAHCWSGWMAISRNHAPAFGQIGAHAWAASCCNGSGIVRHTAAGTLIADVALGIDNPLTGDFLAAGTANRIPPRPLRDLGFALTIARDMWRGRSER